MIKHDVGNGGWSRTARGRLVRLAALALPLFMAAVLAAPSPRPVFAALTITPSVPTSGTTGSAVAMSPFVGTCPTATILWNFGDPNSGGSNTAATTSGQSTLHAYNIAGAYTVQMNATGCSDAGFTTSSILISGTSTSGCTAGTSTFGLSLIASPPSAGVGTSVTLVASGNTASGAIYTWNFGDGTPIQTTTVSSTSHPYYTAGTFTATVTETVGNQTGCGATTVTIGSGASGAACAPTAGTTIVATLAASPNPAPLGTTVTFTAGAGGYAGIPTYTWYFGDSSAPVTTQTNTTTHPYGTSGTFTASVGVTANGQTGCGSAVVTVGSGTTGTGSAFVHVAPNGPYTGAVGQQINFGGFAQTTNNGATISSYSWQFGDGTTGSGPSVTHAYNQPGTYTVTLTATDSTGASNYGTTTATIGGTGTANTTGGTATANGVTANTGGPYSGSAGTAITFNGTASSSNAGASIVSYVWSFGDGTGSSGQQASHAYSSNGTYTLALTVTDSTGAVVTATTPVQIGTGGSSATGTRTVPLVTGCNNIAFTFADNTSLSTVVNGINPQANLLSIWKLTDPSTTKFKGYFPNAAAASDLTTINRLDAGFICVTGPATLTEPNG